LVDQFDTFGLGKDTVVVTGTTSDSMLIFDPKKETFSIFRMAYPMPFYTRGLDGRIDDAKAGWKGRAFGRLIARTCPSSRKRESAR